jgi:hypothetical protein
MFTNGHNPATWATGGFRRAAPTGGFRRLGTPAAGRRHWTPEAGARRVDRPASLPSIEPALV